MDAKVLTLFPGPDVTYKVTGQPGGDYTVQITVQGSDPCPMKGGQGDYLPRTALLVWTTTDGAAWVFRHAILSGPQIERKTGEPGPFPTSQTLYLGDPNYSDCEPVWLARMVAALAPGQVTA
jgi:hypothetical protein